MFNDIIITNSPFGGIYNNLQSLYTDLNNTNMQDFDYEEKITLMVQLKYISDMAKQELYDQLGEYIQDYDTQEMVYNQLNPTAQDKIALITGVSNYWFTGLNYIPPFKGDYVFNVHNLTSNGYHVYWITDEFLTPSILSMVINRMDLNENENTTIYYSYTGHTLKDMVNNTVNGTQRIVLIDGTEITDQELTDLFAVWESEKQFFVLNTCYAEGLALELRKQGRMILSSTPVDGIELISVFAEHTPFYQIIIDNWNWTLSVEENYIILCTVMIDDPVLYDSDEENDLYL